MKRCFASLFAVGIVAALFVVGCGDSATVSQPDTAPPLAPVILGARGGDGVVGIWWRTNTEPDLAGYHIYITQAGQTRRMSRYPIQNNYFSWDEIGTDTVQLYVTAVDWTGNESSPSATKMLSASRDGQIRSPVEGLDHKELDQPR